MSLILSILLLTQTPHETNPVRLVTTAGLRLYKTTLSPSQGDVCNFSPSCSQFARESIARYGIFWGSLMASDRLQRCNPWAFDALEKHYDGIKDHKIHDPIGNNYIFGRIDKENRKHLMRAFQRPTQSP